MLIFVPFILTFLIQWIESQSPRKEKRNEKNERWRVTDLSLCYNQGLCFCLLPTWCKWCKHGMSFPFPTKFKTPVIKQNFPDLKVAAKQPKHVTCSNIPQLTLPSIIKTLENHSLWSSSFADPKMSDGIFLNNSSLSLFTKFSFLQKEVVFFKTTSQSCNVYIIYP